ncbi:hypothetical protein BDZ89DRAFT_1107807 [Hymenopellis radicata]|nr:hypothetical protein BDZ89DRAFT_1107807 [Hymenopellis radicata]
MNGSTKPLGSLWQCCWRKRHISWWPPTSHLCLRRSSNAAVTPSSLEQTRALLSRILPPSNNNPTDVKPERRLELWNGVLTASAQSEPSEITLAVFGADQWSASRELVTALLREPFASDASSDSRIVTRWGNVSAGHLTIVKDADTVSNSASTFWCTSSFLQQFTVPLRIHEFFDAHPTENGLSFLQNDSALHTYLDADIPLIICNPLTTSPADLFRARSFLRNSNTILVFAHTLYGADAVALRERYEKSVEGSTVLFVDPYRASAALDTLKKNPGSSLAVQQYQDGFIQSGIASLHSALSVARMQLKEDQHECDQVFLNTRKVIAHEMDRLSLWKMITRVDEITAIVSSTVAKSFTGIQKQILLPPAKILFVDAVSLTARSSSIPLLRVGKRTGTDDGFTNLLCEASALLGPLKTRQQQIIQYPTARLHVAAQRSVLGLGGSAVTGLALSWVGWLQSMAGHDIVPLLDVNPTTLMGAGGLVILIGLRWAIGNWERSKKRWWADWQRIYDGLERDLAKTLEHIVNNQVLVVASKGSSEMCNIIDQRNQAIAELSEQVSVLENSQPEEKPVTSNK